MKKNVVSIWNKKPMDFLRIILGLLMLIHGLARISLGIVDDFGLFFGSIGLPFGIVLAWVVTSLELLGSFLLFFNFQVKYVSIYFIVQLIMGIFLIHFNEGWFVVGAGRNGMEYSFLLICCFIFLLWNNILDENKLVEDE